MKIINIEQGKQRKLYGLLLWFLVLFAYFLFVFNWMVMNQLQGSANANLGWENAFFDQTPPTITSQAINYTITIMRGIGSIGAGIAIAKFGHKKAVLIAMGLVSAAFPAVAAGYWHSIGGYIIFIIGRMLMAIGGTVLIAYTQPIISRFFSQKGKSMLSRINAFGSNFGTMVPLCLYAIPAVKSSMLNHWQIWGFVVAAIPLLLMIIYWIVAKDIEIKKQAAGFEKNQVLLRPSTWKDVAKDKNTWTLSLFFGLWLTIVTSVMLITRDHFNTLHNLNFANNPWTEWEKQLPAILFLLGVVPGIWIVGWILPTKIDRRFYTAFVVLIGILAIIATYLCVVYVESIVPAAIFMFIAGIALWGIQGVFLNNPHENKQNSPQRVGIVIAFVFGVGYILFTFANILLAIIFDAIKPNSFVDATWVQFGVSLIFMIGAVISAPFIAKTNDQKLITTITKKIKKA